MDLQHHKVWIRAIKARLDPEMGYPYSPEEMTEDIEFLEEEIARLKQALEETQRLRYQVVKERSNRPL